MSLRWAIPVLLALAACDDATAPPPASEVTRAAPPPDYLGIETRLLEGDLVSFGLTLGGVRSRADIDAYARCAAARYALIRGFRFARQVRTQVAERGGIWRADAVYTISQTMPAGTQVIAAETTVAICEAEGIPTV